MLVIHTLFIVQCVWTLSVVEDKFMNNELNEFFLEYIDDLDEEIIPTDFQKREADVLKSQEKSIASIVAPFELSRADHYWTRKRGRDKATPSEKREGIYYTWYLSRPTSGYGLRKKREVFRKLIKIKNLKSRPRRRIEIDDPEAQVGNNSTLSINTSPKMSTDDYKLKQHQTTSQPLRNNL